MFQKLKSTLVRHKIWIPALSMTMVSMVSYIDRNTLAILAPTILRDMQISNEEYGLIISAFSIAYMLCNPVWGRILDKIGVITGMFIAVSIWTFASVMHVFAAGLLGFVVARILLGIGEAATFPGCLRTVVYTLPVDKRSRGIAVAYSGGSLGALITPIIVTPIAATWGWESAFWFTGIIGIAWLIFWFFVTRKNRILQSENKVEKIKKIIKWSEPKIWAFMAIDALGSFPSAIINYYAANYLFTVLGKDQLQIGQILWIPPLGWEIGYFFWAWIVDKYASSGRSIKAVQNVFIILLIFTIPFAFFHRITNFYLVLVMMFYVMFITAGFIISATAYATSNLPKDYAGTIAGLGAGSSALVVSLTMPIVGRLFDLGKYDMTFFMMAIIPFLGFGIWRLLNQKALRQPTLN